MMYATAMTVPTTSATKRQLMPSDMAMPAALVATPVANGLMVEYMLPTDAPTKMTAMHVMAS